MGGAGSQGGGHRGAAAERQPRSARHGGPRAAPGGAAAAAGASRDSPGQGARGGRGAAPAVPAGRGRAGASRAPRRRPRGAPSDLQSPSARGGRKPLQRRGRPPPRLGRLRTGRNCDAESQKEDPLLPPRSPLFKFRGFGDTAAVRGADSAPRGGSRRGLCAGGNPAAAGSWRWGHGGLGGRGDSATHLTEAGLGLPARSPPPGRSRGEGVCGHVCVRTRKCADGRGGVRNWDVRGQVAL